jgi:NADH-quinone oxidoreductase subunit L
VLWLIGALTAFGTAFYIGALAVLDVLGRAARTGAGGGSSSASGARIASLDDPCRSSSWQVLSIAGGWIGIPAVLGGGNPFEKFLAPVFEAAPTGKRSRMRRRTAAGSKSC